MYLSGGIGGDKLSVYIVCVGGSHIFIFDFSGISGHFGSPGPETFLLPALELTRISRKNLKIRQLLLFAIFSFFEVLRYLSTLLIHVYIYPLLWLRHTPTHIHIHTYMYIHACMHACVHTIHMAYGTCSHESYILRV